MKKKIINTEENINTSKKGNSIIKKMSTTLLATALIVSMTFTLTGCGNHDVFDTVYTYNYAIILNDNGGTIVPIKQWGDYEGEQYQIITQDGTVLLTSSYDTKLINTQNSDLTPEDVIKSLRGQEAEINYLESSSKNLSK